MAKTILIDSGCIVAALHRRDQHHAWAREHLSLADACLVRMAELIDDSVIFTVDSDFRTYRKHGRQIIPLITPH